MLQYFEVQLSLFVTRLALYQSSLSSTVPPFCAVRGVNISVYSTVPTYGMCMESGIDGDLDRYNLAPRKQWVNRGRILSRDYRKPGILSVGSQGQDDCDTAVLTRKRQCRHGKCCHQYSKNSNNFWTVPRPSWYRCPSSKVAICFA